MSERIRVIAVDDEPLALSRIAKALARHPDVDLVGEISDGDTAVETIMEAAPDVVFLDIHMPGRDGFGVLAALPDRLQPVVVFITAHDEYALRAFRVHAADYLVKPFDDEQFDETMSNVRDRLGQRRSARAPALREVLAELGAPTRFAQRVRVAEDQRSHFVVVDSIRYLEADGNYVVIHTGEQSHRVRSSLLDLHNRLDPATFVRIHRATVVNLNYLREIQPWFSGAYLAILTDGTQLRISRTFRDDIMRLTL